MRRGSKKTDVDHWLLTFGDLTTLLLTFFVMLFAVSAMGGSGVFMKALKSISHNLKTDSPREKLLLGAIEKSVDLTGEERGALLSALQSLMGLEQEYGGIKIEVTDLGLVVRAETPILFDIARADLKPSCYPILEGVEKLYRAKECNIAVYGHTCDLPIRTFQYPSNWELSCARALSVVQFLQRRGIKGENLSATGCADTYPVAENTSEANRKLNRRVEIYLDFRTKEL